MGHPQSAFFNFVHTADEPADLVRELGLLFDAPQRRHVILETISGGKPDARGACQSLMSRCLHSDLDFSRAVNRLRSQVASAKGPSAREREDFLMEADQLQEAGYGSWLRFRDRLLVQGVRVDNIDDLVIAGELVEMKQSKPRQLFPSCEARHWDNHRASPGTFP